MIDTNSNNPSVPLTVDEVMTLFRYKWGVSYDLQILVKNNSLYLQMMWGYLEQQSFPMNESNYRKRINNVVEIINRVGQADIFRLWINDLESKPRIGRALTLHLMTDERSDEFVV